MSREEALTILLAMPDERTLRRRRYLCYTQARHPAFNPEIIKRNLATAYAQHRRQELQTGGDISCIVSLRRSPRLKMVRHA